MKRILITLMLTSVFYHSSLGLQVVIEDYIHDIKIRKLENNSQQNKLLNTNLKKIENKELLNKELFINNRITFKNIDINSQYLSVVFEGQFLDNEIHVLFSLKPYGPGFKIIKPFFSKLFFIKFQKMLQISMTKVEAD